LLDDVEKVIGPPKCEDVKKETPKKNGEVYALFMRFVKGLYLMKKTRFLRHPG
jgi:hypothetical protein